MGLSTFTSKEFVILCKVSRGGNDYAVMQSYDSYDVYNGIQFLLFFSLVGL